jgi:hypothetical protein
VDIGFVENAILVFVSCPRLSHYLWRMEKVMILLYLHKELGNYSVEEREVVLFKLFHRFEVRCIIPSRVLLLLLLFLLLLGDLGDLELIKAALI